MARFAAIDIGSNSIRLKIADTKISGGLPDVHTIESFRVVTRLGEGVYQKKNKIKPKSMKKTLNVLEEMAAKCDTRRIAGARAVATSALRDAENAEEFVGKAQEILGIPVEIIPGPKEADLVHLGVHALWPALHGQESLIVDLGGGSAQFIYGHSRKIIDRVSRPLGALRLTKRFLLHDPPRTSELRQMNEFIDEKMCLAIEQVRADAVPFIIGTASTAAAIVCHHRLIQRSERERADRQEVTLEEVKSFYRKISTMTLSRRRKLIGVGWRRAELLVPGVAVINRILAGFKLPELRYSAASIADGIIATFAMAEQNVEMTHQELHNVFLSYNSADKAAVRAIAKRLKDQGVVPFFDEEHLRPGAEWQIALDQQIRNIPSAAVFIGPKGVGNSQKEEIATFLREFPSRKRPIVPVLLEGASRRQLPRSLRERTWVDFNEKRPDPLKHLISGLIPIPSSMATAGRSRSRH